MIKKILNVFKNVVKFLILWFMVFCTILTVLSAVQYLLVKYDNTPDDIGTQTVYHVEVKEITI